MENEFNQMHPIDALNDLENIITSLSGTLRTFQNTIGLSESARFICQGKTTVQPYVTFDGPIYLGENSFIGPYCFLRGPLYIGPNVTIGAYSEIKNSIIMSGSAITHRNIIPDSVLQQNVWLAGGVMITNLRIDKKPVKFTWNDIQKTSPKFGLFAEQSSILGVGVTVMPGTHLTANKTVFGPTTIKGVV